MSEVKLGTPPPKDAQRDAVHVAIFPCIAGQKLKPGQHVKIDGGKAYSAKDDAVGIVDPFLRESVANGVRMYVCLYPASVIGMRHHWQHPAFDGDKAQSEQWLRNYAARVNCYDGPEAAFERLIEGLKDKQLYFYGSDLHGLYELDQADELRRHAETYLGVSIHWDDFGFSCSC